MAPSITLGQVLLMDIFPDVHGCLASRFSLPGFPRAGHLTRVGLALVITNIVVLRSGAVEYFNVLG